MAFMGAVWGVMGVLLLIGVAILRLTPPAIDAFSYQFAWYHWLLLLLSTPITFYLKAYRGFYKGLSRRVAVRALFAFRNPTFARTVLSPLFCMGYFQITGRKQTATLGMTAGMIALIILVRQLGQPLRGIIDANIVLALSAGWLTTLYFAIKAFAGREIDYPVMVDEPDVQESAVADPVIS